MNEATVKEAPDYCGPVVAWRVWYAVQLAGETRLSSVYHPAFWPVRQPLEAVCDRRRLPFREKHAAPTRGCTCGIYAALPTTIGDSFVMDVLRPAAIAVVGCVSLWGVVVECERGWRASFAYPERLFVLAPGHCSDVAASVAGLKRYGVPVEAVDASASVGADDGASSGCSLGQAIPGSGGATGLRGAGLSEALPQFWRQ